MQSLEQKIAFQSKRKFENQYANKFKRNHSMTAAYTVISSIGFVQKAQIDQIKIITVCNGTKSLPYSVCSAHQKKVLKDMHAQILCIKAFRKWALIQIRKSKEVKSKYFKFCAKKNKYFLDTQHFKLFLYSSETFCGDCSTSESENKFSGGKPLKYFDSKEVIPNNKFQKNILRTKPGRIDLPYNKRSLSLSCSDKLALYNVVGIQGKDLFPFLKPIYIEKFIVQCDSNQCLDNVSLGLNFVKRLSNLKNKPQKLIKNLILKVFIKELKKYKVISNQFQANSQFKVICIDKAITQKNQNKSNEKQGFQVSLISVQQSHVQWINGKTGLPEGSSLKNYESKGKVSEFCRMNMQNQIDQFFGKNLQSNDSWKYSAIKARIGKLFGIWTDSYKDIKSQ